MTAIRPSRLASDLEALRFALPRQRVGDGTTLAPTQGVETKPKTMIVTGAGQGIGTGVTRALLEHGYNVVANSLHFAEGGLAPSENLALVQGDIATPSTSEQIGAIAISRFGSIDGVVKKADIYFIKPFPEFTAQDFERLFGDKSTGLYLPHTSCEGWQHQRPQQWDGGSLSRRRKGVHSDDGQRWQ